MIALDTNVLVRYLVRDNIQQAEAAHSLLKSLVPGHLGFVCREVAVELVWVLERAYKYPRSRIADAMEMLVTAEELRFEAADDVLRAVHDYRNGGAGFSDQMIAAAARRAGADTLFTFDQRAAKLLGADLVPQTVHHAPPPETGPGM